MKLTIRNVTGVVLGLAILLFIITNIFALFNVMIQPFRLLFVFMLTIILWFIILGRKGLALLGVLLIT